LTSGLTDNNNSTQSLENGSSSTLGEQTENSTSDNASSAAPNEQSTSQMIQGITNISDIENATGSNKEIFANNTYIDSNIITLQGMEQSQLGNTIPGEQNTSFEGQRLQNAT
jgi:hypothetical protein